MSILDQALATPLWELPPAEKDEPMSFAFASAAAQVAEALTRVGRVMITWSSKTGTWGLGIVDGAVRVASPIGDICTWIPGDEMNVRISADDKFGALSDATAALETLIAE